MNVVAINEITRPVKISNRLMALLRYAKSNEPVYSWRAAGIALGDVYHPEMTVADSMHHLVAALEELLSEPRFQSGNAELVAQDLLLAPIRGSYSIEVLGRRSLDTSYTIDQFYSSMASFVIGKLRLSKISWCREEFLTQPF